MENVKILVIKKNMRDVCLTVIIGSSGPKISSVISSDSSGGSNNIVGSMNLHGVGRTERGKAKAKRKQKELINRRIYKLSSSIWPPCTMDALTNGSSRSFFSLKK